MSGIKSKLSDNDDLFKLLSFPTMWCHDTTVDTGVRIKYANMLFSRYYLIDYLCPF